MGDLGGRLKVVERDPRLGAESTLNTNPDATGKPQWTLGQESGLDDSLNPIRYEYSSNEWYPYISAPLRLDPEFQEVLARLRGTRNTEEPARRS